MHDCARICDSRHRRTKLNTNIATDKDNNGKTSKGVV